MTSNQPFEYFAACAVGLSAFFIFLQVAIFGEVGRGWIDRPWYIRGPMSLVAASLCYKFYAWGWGGEHFTHGGAIASASIMVWQFTSVFYAVTQSYKIRSEAITKVLFDNHPAWGQTEPGSGDPNLFRGSDRQDLQRDQSTMRQNERRKRSS